MQGWSRSKGYPPFCFLFPMREWLLHWWIWGSPSEENTRKSSYASVCQSKKTRKYWSSSILQVNSQLQLWENNDMIWVLCTGVPQKLKSNSIISTFYVHHCSSYYQILPIVINRWQVVECCCWYNEFPTEQTCVRECVCVCADVEVQFYELLKLVKRTESNLPYGS